MIDVVDVQKFGEKFGPDVFLQVPRHLQFDVVLAEFLYRLHVLAEKHHVHGASDAEYVRLIGPGAAFQHFGTCETVGLNDLEEIRSI